MNVFSSPILFQQRWSNESLPSADLNGSSNMKWSRSIEDLAGSYSNLSSESRKPALRTQLAYQLSGNSNKLLRRPIYPIRPSSGVSKANGVLPFNKTNGNLVLERNALLPVFRLLSASDLAHCALVCRAWSQLSSDPALWQHMDLSRKRLTAACLAGIVRRQPECLILDWTGIAKRQLAWLVARLPQLKELSLKGCAWSGVAALRTCTCPPLVSLDLSYVSGMNDGSLRDVLSPPPDSRPGLVDTKSRLRNLRTLKLAGCDLSDVSLRYIVQNLPQLTTLDVSSCSRLTDAGVAQLATAPAATITTLTCLDLSGCRLLTEASLEHLTRCTALERIDLRHDNQITSAAISKFLSGRNGFTVTDGKLIEKCL